MKSQTRPCLWSCIPQSEPAPRDRHKHACCTHGNSVYLFGGRETNVQNDFWRYNVVSNEWHELDCNTDGAPEELEEHTMEAHQGVLYVFGGMLDSAYSEGKTPLWMYAIGKGYSAGDRGFSEAILYKALIFLSSLPDTEEWVHWQRTANNAGGVLYVFGGMLDSAYNEGKTPLWMYAIGKGYSAGDRGFSEAILYKTLIFLSSLPDTEEWVHWQRTANNAGRPVPINRKGHSAVIWDSAMHVYGGYIDMKGSSQEFWTFHFGPFLIFILELLLFLFQRPVPINRKGHSAVIWDSAMHVYGGYIDMKGSSQEFWTFHFDSQEWSLPPPSSCDAGPGPRHGHSATVYRSAMFLYGGLMGLREQSDFWKWNFCSQSWACIKTLFTSLSWEKLGTSTGTVPPSKIYHCCAGLGPSFQPQSSRDCLPQGSPTSHERNNCPKYRLFKNRCSPASNCVAPKCPQEGIEMQTFFIQSDREPQGGREEDTLLHSPVRMESCIADRIACEGPPPQDSFISYLEAEDSMVARLPDSLLVIGGKPWFNQTSVSIWQMILSDVQKHGRRADSASGNATTE
ncbi:UNVERIFIED_CONTAM: hypothetical protein FKN15_002527 [Acipenser sinensis]